MSRTALVTGGASGIGRSTAERLKQAGHQVAILDLNRSAVSTAAEELGVFGVTADVADRTTVDAAVAEVRSQLGGIEIIVTSAGVNTPSDFATMPFADWERSIAINLHGTFHCIQAVIADMIGARWGRIVTISSVAAQGGAPGLPAYVAAKGAVIALTKALSHDYSRLGITANTIPPSVVDTPMLRSAEAEGAMDVGMMAQMTPVGRLGTPDDIAATCAFLCSDDASFITGQVIGVNGGWYL